jgi:membrane-bound lytic murein transglycosylase D
MIEQHNPGLRGRHLRIGETIIIPAFGDAPPPPPAITPPRQISVNHDFRGTHIVQRGETLWSISRIYGISPQVLAEANDMESNQILREGRALKVPIIE